MSHNPAQCQQEFGYRWFSVAKISGILVLACCCGGCWEEVRFESEKAEAVKATLAEGLPAPVEEIEADVAVEAVGGEVESVEVVPGVEIAAEGGEDMKIDLEVGEDVVSPPAEASSPGGGEGEGLEVWQLASRWSMVVALQAKNIGADRYGERLELAVQGARGLGVVLPELPSFESGAKRLPVSLSYLLEEAGPVLVEGLKEKYGAERAALAELAMKSNVLLLVYTPKSTRVEPLITAIRKAAEVSGLPEPVWRELIDLLEARAEFKQVKAAVYQLHQRAVAVLNSEIAS